MSVLLQVLAEEADKVFDAFFLQVAVEDPENQEQDEVGPQVFPKSRLSQIVLR